MSEPTVREPPIEVGALSDTEEQVMRVMKSQVQISPSKEKGQEEQKVLERVVTEPSPTIKQKFK